MDVLSFLALLISAGLGAAISLVTSLITTKINVRQQKELADENRIHTASEARRAEAKQKMELLLDLLTDTLLDRKSLSYEEWVNAGYIDTSKIVSLAMLIPDSRFRKALEGIRHSISLSYQMYAVCEEDDPQLWEVERQALEDARETVATYLRGDELDEELLSRQTKRNDRWKTAHEKMWELLKSGDL